MEFKKRYSLLCFVSTDSYNFCDRICQNQSDNENLKPVKILNYLHILDKLTKNETITKWKAMIYCPKNRSMSQLTTDWERVGSALSSCALAVNLLASRALSRRWSATARSLWLRLERGISIELLALSKVHFGAARGWYQENAYWIYSFWTTCIHKSKHFKTSVKVRVIHLVLRFSTAFLTS